VRRTAIAAPAFAVLLLTATAGAGTSTATARGAQPCTARSRTPLSTAGGMIAFPRLSGTSLTVSYTSMSHAGPSNLAALSTEVCSGNRPKSPVPYYRVCAAFTLEVAEATTLYHSHWWATIPGVGQSSRSTYRFHLFDRRGANGYWHDLAAGVRGSIIATPGSYYDFTFVPSDTYTIELLQNIGIGSPQGSARAQDGNGRVDCSGEN